MKKPINKNIKKIQQKKETVEELTELESIYSIDTKGINVADILAALPGVRTIEEYRKFIKDNCK